MIKDYSEESKSLVRSCRLRAIPHKKLPHAVNSYMIGNKFGELIGGNRMDYMFTNEQNNICYPTLFKSRREIESFLRASDVRVANIEKYCYDHNMGDHDA